MGVTLSPLTVIFTVIYYGDKPKIFPVNVMFCYVLPTLVSLRNVRFCEVLYGLRNLVFSCVFYGFYKPLYLTLFSLCYRVFFRVFSFGYLRWSFIFSTPKVLPS